MSEYTPSIDEIREAWLSAEFEERDSTTSDDDLRAEFARALAAHDAKVRASVVAEEPEWEYGACYQGDNGRELLWFSMGNSGFKDCETAEKEVERYADAQIRLCRRRKAGPWEPVN